MQITITPTADQQQISVTSPYHVDFVSRARAIGGRWSGTSKTWVFDAAAEEIVRVTLRDVYGTDGADEQLGITAPATLYVYCTHQSPDGERAPVTMRCGITLARAFGRDSGARLGDSVAHLRGAKPRSGGSAKNWITRVPDGCLLAVYQVPRGLAERALLDPDYVCAIGDGSEQIDAIYSQLAAAAEVH